MPAAGNYILGAVGPSGGPQFCNNTTGSYFGDTLPDICSTKSATCCHTPVFTYIYGRPFLEEFILLAPLDSPGYYEMYESNISSAPSGCDVFSPTGGNVTYKDLSTGDVTNTDPGRFGQVEIFVNYGASISLDFTMRIPYVQQNFENCWNLGRLELFNANSDNRGVLIGDHWYDNTPDRPSPTIPNPFPTPYRCRNNPSITRIYTPFEEGIGSYAADINSFAFAADIESFICNTSNYCCSCYGQPNDPGILECERPCPGNLPDGLINPPCVCSYMGDYLSPCYTNMPYVNLQGSFLYTCDVPCGVRIQLVLFQGLGSAAGYALYPEEKGYFNLTCTDISCP